MEEEYMLSTIDNPYSPFDEFDKWFKFDVVHGYNSCSLLARLTYTTEELSDNLNELEIQRVLDEIVNVNINGMFCLVRRQDFEKSS